MIPRAKPQNAIVCNIFLRLPPHWIYQELAKELELSYRDRKTIYIFRLYK